MQLLDLREACCECVVFVFDLADADHKQWAALQKTTFADVTEAKINAMLLLSIKEKSIQSDHYCRGFFADV